MSETYRVMAGAKEMAMYRDCANGGHHGCYGIDYLGNQEEYAPGAYGYAEKTARELVKRGMRDVRVLRDDGTIAIEFPAR